MPHSKIVFKSLTGPDDTGHYRSPDMDGLSNNADALGLVSDSPGYTASLQQFINKSFERLKILFNVN